MRITEENHVEVIERVIIREPQKGLAFHSLMDLRQQFAAMEAALHPGEFHVRMVNQQAD